MGVVLHSLSVDAVEAIALAGLPALCCGLSRRASSVLANTRVPPFNLSFTCCVDPRQRFGWWCRRACCCCEGFGFARRARTEFRDAGGGRGGGGGVKEERQLSVSEKWGGIDEGLGGVRRKNAVCLFVCLVVCLGRVEGREGGGDGLLMGGGRRAEGRRRCRESLELRLSARPPVWSGWEGRSDEFRQVAGRQGRTDRDHSPTWPQPTAQPTSRHQAAIKRRPDVFGTGLPRSGRADSLRGSLAPEPRSELDDGTRRPARWLT